MRIEIQEKGIFAMYSFQNDYSEGAHPNILRALETINYHQNNSYGLDEHSDNARELIQEALEDYSVDIHFIAGGTLTNLTFISHILRPYEAVLSADTGHINTHETGAIESTGHKVFSIPADDGKLTPDLIRPVLKLHENEHWVEPRLVYISNPTEVGTVYTKEELEILYAFCKRHDLYLYMDGARLAMALAVEETHLTFPDLPDLCDAFYIGGTKVGAMFGEALVIVKEEFKDHFRFNMKQHGAILAKGWMMGVQFEELFKEGLYLELGRKGVAMAQILKDVFEKAGIPLLAPAPTNQVFPIFPDALAEAVNERFLTTFQCKPDPEYTCLRFCTSWATSEDAVRDFASEFEDLAAKFNR